ncbi:hypothetical protein FRC07_003929 [Ceratobasidium sp. 392]|nr:hypothetical protein FRC07_003929 [Ceratobasidium sp. 392]
MSPSLQPDRRLAIDALVADHVPSPPRTRQCGKCQEAHTRCDGRDPCRACEVRGTLCGYAWSSFSAAPPPPSQHPSPPAPAPRTPGYAQHVLYFPPPAKRPARPEPQLTRAPPTDGGWAIVPVGTNAPAVLTRSGEPGPPIKPCKTCQARNTTCDGVLPVCGSCRTRRLECYIASPATAAAAPERPRVQSLMRDKGPLHQRAFPLSTAQAHPPQSHPHPPQSGRSRALSSNEDGKPSRASLSFMLNPTPAELPVASTSRAPPPRLPELKRPSQPAPTALVTPPTPIAPNGMEHAQSRMEISQSRMEHSQSRMEPEPRLASPLSPTSSSTGGADLSRRPSRKRSASPSSYERWGSSSPSRESVSSTPRLSVESPRPSGDEDRTRSKSSLSHLLDGDGQGGMKHPSHPVPGSSSRAVPSGSSHPVPASSSRPTSSSSHHAGSPHATTGPSSHAASTNSSSRPNSKRGSISTAMADMQLKSATTSRASSPGSTRSGGAIQAHAWPTFGAVGETMVMRPVGESMRRRSEGAKRRRIGVTEDDTVMEPDVSIVEQLRRASGEDVSRRSLVDDLARRTSAEDSVRRMSGDSVARRTSNGDAISRRTSNGDTVARRATGDNASRQNSIPMPGAWVAEERESAIVVSDSPELQSNDRMILEADEPKEALISGPVQTGEAASRNGVGEGSSKNGAGEPKMEPLSQNGSLADSIKTKRSPSTDGRNGSTPPIPSAFAHIWPPPTIPGLETKKGRKAKIEPEPMPSRSFITQRNLSIAPAPTPEEDTKDKDAGGSILRSMLTTMPSRVVFMTAVQTFLAQTKRKGRTVVMTKALMKDALGVLLDPATEELLKDYAPPEQQQQQLEEDKSSRDGTPTQARKLIDASDHTSLEFRAWAKRMFSTVKTARGEDVLAFSGKPVVVEDDIYETIVLSHSKGNHCSAEETLRLVDQEHSWVPRVLVEAFVRECPGCPASNKVTSTATKPKKRKWVRKEDKPATTTTKRKPAARRGKKTQEGGKKRKGKEASPVEESEGEAEEEQEQEQEAEGEQEQEQDMEEDELGEEVVQDEAEEDEMESEDEHVSAKPVAIVASSVPAAEKMEVDES